MGSVLFDLYAMQKIVQKSSEPTSNSSRVQWAPTQQAPISATNHVNGRRSQSEWSNGTGACWRISFTVETIVPQSTIGNDSRTYYTDDLLEIDSEWSIELKVLFTVGMLTPSGKQWKYVYGQLLRDMIIVLLLILVLNSWPRHKPRQIPAYSVNFRWNVRTYMH